MFIENATDFLPESDHLSYGLEAAPSGVALNGSGRTPPRIAPETFRTSRLLDFATTRELTAQIGHQPGMWPQVMVRTPSLPLERVTAERQATAQREGGLVADLLTHDAGRAIRAVEAGKSMAEIGLGPERLRLMAQTEERLADPPNIWPDMPYAEQRTRAQRLQEIEAFELAKLWRVLAQDHDRVSQRVVIARGIQWRVSCRTGCSSTAQPHR